MYYTSLSIYNHPCNSENFLVFSEPVLRESTHKLELVLGHSSVRMNLLGNIFHKDSHSHKQSYDFGQVSAWPAYQLFSDIIQVLGQGGFGVVSKAHDKEANKDVAIKKVPKKSIKSASLSFPLESHTNNF